jgi:hypothetical protein
MAKHIHAESMMQYAQDALESETPWEKWEYTYNKIWKPLIQHPSWDLCVYYRRKPKTIVVNGFTINAPLDKKPKDHSIVFYPDLTTTYFAMLVPYSDEYYDVAFDNGILFDNANDATAMGKAMLGIDPHTNTA